LKALNKKEHKNGGCSPDSPGDDVDATDYTLTPRTEAKYNKIDEEFQMMMQRTQHLNGAQRVSDQKNSGNSVGSFLYTLFIYLFRVEDTRCPFRYL
jgi:MADS-box transcription enhancer factor 2